MLYLKWLYTSEFSLVDLPHFVLDKIYYWVVEILFVCGLVLQFVGLFANLVFFFCFMGGLRERSIPPLFIHIFQQWYFETGMVILMSHRKKKKNLEFLTSNFPGQS